jgi:hypothetical protein
MMFDLTADAEFDQLAVEQLKAKVRHILLIEVENNSASFTRKGLMKDPERTERRTKRAQRRAKHEQIAGDSILAGERGYALFDLPWLDLL